METFEETKKYILDFAKTNNACQSEFKRVNQSDTFEEILLVVSENIDWVREKGLFNGQNINDFFSQDDLINVNLFNMGIANLGFANTGDSNIGNNNTGDRNIGNSNTGDWNIGDWNTGYCNIGYSNIGNRNTGYSNIGNNNTGYSNIGNSNTGDWNIGDWNTGCCNIGDWNIGVFCTGQKTIPIFNKPSNWTIEDFNNSKSFRVFQMIETTFWINSENMNQYEKEAYPSHKTTGGYLKQITLKEAWLNLWPNLSEDLRNGFKDLPNWNTEIFKEITGIDFQ